MEQRSAPRRETEAQESSFLASDVTSEHPGHLALGAGEAEASCQLGPHPRTPTPQFPTLKFCSSPGHKPLDPRTPSPCISTFPLLPVPTTAHQGHLTPTGLFQLPPCSRTRHTPTTPSPRHVWQRDRHMLWSGAGSAGVVGSPGGVPDTQQMIRHGPPTHSHCCGPGSRPQGGPEEQRPGGLVCPQGLPGRKLAPCHLPGAAHWPTELCDKQTIPSTCLDLMASSLLPRPPALIRGCPGSPAPTSHLDYLGSQVPSRPRPHVAETQQTHDEGGSSADPGQRRHQGCQGREPGSKSRPTQVRADFWSLSQERRTQRPTQAVPKVTHSEVGMLAPRGWPGAMS